MGRMTEMQEEINRLRAQQKTTVEDSAIRGDSRHEIIDARLKKLEADVARLIALVKDKENHNG